MSANARCVRAHAAAFAHLPGRSADRFVHVNGATGHDYHDRDSQFGFRQVDYEAIQHFPILREAWVISRHGLVQTAFDKADQQTPLFMLPAVGGGSSLRGFSSWRFRDQNSLLLPASAAWAGAAHESRRQAVAVPDD